MGQKLKVYYAHCMAIYDTPQEKRDVATLYKLKFDVENPNSAHHLRECARYSVSMDYFLHIVKKCSAVGFRSLPDGRISSGVALEIKFAKEHGIPVFELPSNITSRMISLSATNDYLLEIGQR